MNEGEVLSATSPPPSHPPSNKRDLSFVESESKVVFREENMGVLFIIDHNFQRAHWRDFRS